MCPSGSLVRTNPGSASTTRLSSFSIPALCWQSTIPCLISMSLTPVRRLADRDRSSSILPSLPCACAVFGTHDGVSPAWGRVPCPGSAPISGAPHQRMHVCNGLGPPSHEDAPRTRACPSYFGIGLWRRAAPACPALSETVRDTAGGTPASRRLIPKYRRYHRLIASPSRVWSNCCSVLCRASPCSGEAQWPVFSQGVHHAP
jgi:hypothetical protein